MRGRKWCLAVAVLMLASVSACVYIHEGQHHYPSQVRYTLAPATGGFEPLFNGKDLTGLSTEGNWVVKKGGVLGIEPRSGEEGWKRFEDYLWTKKKYGDFVLDLEFKIPPEGNSGVFFRVADRDNPVEEGIEVQINDVHGKEEVGPHDCGGVIGAVGPSNNMAKPAGEWNHMVITCRGNELHVSLNGVKVVDVDLSETSQKDRPPKGYMGLQDHGLNAYFRNVMIKEL